MIVLEIFTLDLRINMMVITIGDVFNCSCWVHFVDNHITNLNILIIKNQVIICHCWTLVFVICQPSQCSVLIIILELYRGLVVSFIIRTEPLEAFVHKSTHSLTPLARFVRFRRLTVGNNQPMTDWQHVDLQTRTSTGSWSLVGTNSIGQVIGYPSATDRGNIG